MFASGAVSFKHFLHLLDAFRRQPRLVRASRYDVTIVRNIPGSVSIGAVGDSFNDADVDFGGGNSMFLAEIGEIARAPAVVEALTRIVQFVLHVLMLLNVVTSSFQESETAFLCFGHHPIQGDERHAMLWVAAAHVRVNAGEPNLLDALVLAVLLVP